MRMYATKTDDGRKQDLMIGFEIRAVIDEDASTKAGHPVHKDREYITKMVPSDRSNMPCRPVTDKDRREFSEQYQHWKRSITEKAKEGMALEAWPGATRAQVEDLRGRHVFTVEQFAVLPDEVCSSMGSEFPHLRQSARDYLENAKSAAGMVQLRAELEELKAQHEATLSQLQTAKDELRALKSAPPERRGPGRPPNSARAEQ